jgi:secreted PhoX family phosphatase
MAVNAPNPRAKNQYGHIVRWVPEGGDHGAGRFAWDLFVVAGNPAVHGDAYAGSANITADNMFNSPDGLAFDSTGALWIQTDGNYSNEGDFAGQGNNQMLVADTETGAISRFLVGPMEAEVTGLTWSVASTAPPCSSASSTPARTATATSPTAATRCRAPASSRCAATTAARSAEASGGRQPGLRAASPRVGAEAEVAPFPLV